MSVGLLTIYKDPNRKDEYLPVIGEKSFHRVWKRYFDRDQFHWLPQLDTGFPIVEADCLAVLNELHALRRRAVEKGITPQDLERMERAIRCLSQVNWEEVREIYFG